MRETHPNATFGNQYCPGWLLLQVLGWLTLPHARPWFLREANGVWPRDFSVCIGFDFAGTLVEDQFL